jgi:genome maintenance exonuclease 1
MFNYCPPKVLPNLESVTLPNGKRHYVTPNGVKLPSVTTVIGAKEKKGILEWRKRVGEAEANRISKIASGRGNRVHLMAEQYLNNEEIQWSKCMPDAVEAFSQIKPYLDNVNNIHYQEQALWSETIGMAGRVDLIAEWDGVLSVIDFKTSKKVKEREDIPNYFAQCVAYSLMYQELVGVPIKQIVVLMSVDEGSPCVYVEKTRDHINTLVDYIKYYKTTVREN